MWFFFKCRLVIFRCCTYSTFQLMFVKCKIYCYIWYCYYDFLDVFQVPRRPRHPKRSHGGHGRLRCIQRKGDHVPRVHSTTFHGKWPATVAEEATHRKRHRRHRFPRGKHHVYAGHDCVAFFAHIHCRTSRRSQFIKYEVSFFYIYYPRYYRDGMGWIS